MTGTVLYIGDETKMQSIVLCRRVGWCIICNRPIISATAWSATWLKSPACQDYRNIRKIAVQVINARFNKVYCRNKSALFAQWTRWVVDCTDEKIFNTHPQQLISHVISRVCPVSGPNERQDLQYDCTSTSTMHVATIDGVDWNTHYIVCVIWCFDCCVTDVLRSHKCQMYLVKSYQITGNVPESVCLTINTVLCECNVTNGIAIRVRFDYEA